MIFCRRRIGLGKIIIFLVVVVIFLQVFHMSLLTHLDVKGSATGPKQSNDKHASTFSTIAADLISKLGNSHGIDNSGTYKIIQNLILAKAKDTQKKSKEIHSAVVTSSNDSDVTIITQATANHLHNLVALSERWEGPISVSVFTYQDNAVHAVYAILYAHLCVATVARWVTFHLVYPLSHPPKDIRRLLTFKDFSCHRNQAEMQRLLANYPSNYDITGIEYPHNLLRNLAIKNRRTQFAFMIDIDMLPSLDLRTNFRSFINRHKLPLSNESAMGRTAYVVPVFEGRDDLQKVPNTKTELLDRWKHRLARPFYLETCWKCQSPTGYERWKNLPEVSVLDIAYSVTWTDPWEPFYIAEGHSLPLYDERFKQYGFNRISQVCEMHIAGYQFGVLSNAFLVHQGFKVPSKFHPEKDKEQDKNRLLFRKFKGELKVKYPESPRRCY